MDPVYQELIERVKERRVRDRLPADVEKRCRDTLSAILGFLNAMKEDGLALDVSEFSVPHAIAYCCRFSNGNELVLCCRGNIFQQKRFQVQVAKGNKTTWEKTDAVMDFLAEANTPKDGVLIARKLIDHIIEIAGEPPRP